MLLRTRLQLEPPSSAAAAGAKGLAKGLAGSPVAALPSLKALLTFTPALAPPAPLAPPERSKAPAPSKAESRRETCHADDLIGEPHAGLRPMADDRRQPPSIKMAHALHKRRRADHDVAPCPSSALTPKRLRKW